MKKERIWNKENYAFISYKREDEKRRNKRKNELNFNKNTYD